MNKKVIPTVEFYKRDPIKYNEYRGIKIHVPLLPVIKLFLFTLYYSLKYRVIQLKRVIK